MNWNQFTYQFASGKNGTLYFVRDFGARAVMDIFDADGVHICTHRHSSVADARQEAENSDRWAQGSDSCADTGAP